VLDPGTGKFGIESRAELERRQFEVVLVIDDGVIELPELSHFIRVLTEEGFVD
jgi:hypothetical protein